MLNHKLKMLKLLKEKHRPQLSKMKQEFDNVNNAATEQKSQTDAIN